MDDKYVTVNLLTIILLFTQVTSQCIQKSPCSCTLPDGSGYDFSSLANEGPLNCSAVNNANVTFWFQPCKDIILSNITAEDGCNKPVSICAWDKSDPTQKGPSNRGTIAESTLELEPKNDQILMLVYKHNKKVTNILLTCSTRPSSLLIYDSPSSNSSITNLLLLSPVVCKHHKQPSSGGSLFFLLLLIFAAIYFIGGALALKFLRGATGWEMLPNHTFWCTLGRQLKIGFMFICSGCKEDSYEQI